MLRLTSVVVKGYRTVPVVYGFSADPAATGIAADLAHPFFNARGITLMKRNSTERLECCMSSRPKRTKSRSLRTHCMLARSASGRSLAHRARAAQHSPCLFLNAQSCGTRPSPRCRRGASPQALIAFSEGFVVENRDTIINFALRHRLPLISGWAIMAKRAVRYLPMVRVSANPIAAPPTSSAAF